MGRKCVEYHALFKCPDSRVVLILNVLIGKQVMADHFYPYSLTGTLSLPLLID
jgi:hypothetical protein